MFFPNYGHSFFLYLPIQKLHFCAAMVDSKLTSLISNVGIVLFWENSTKKCLFYLSRSSNLWLSETGGLVFFSQILNQNIDNFRRVFLWRKDSERSIGTSIMEMFQVRVLRMTFLGFQSHFSPKPRTFVLHWRYQWKVLFCLGGKIGKISVMASRVGIMIVASFDFILKKTECIVKINSCFSESKSLIFFYQNCNQNLFLWWTTWLKKIFLRLSVGILRFEVSRNCRFWWLISISNSFFSLPLIWKSLTKVPIEKFFAINYLKKIFQLMPRVEILIFLSDDWKLSISFYLVCTLMFFLNTGINFATI